MIQLRNLRTLVALLALSVAMASGIGIAPASGASSSLPHLHWFAQGQCTHYAYQKRPDIVDQGYSQHGYLHWDAWRWAGQARKTGFSVDRKPRAGDIAVWQPGVGGAGSKGHLAFVRSVTAAGKVKITEVNWNGKKTPTNRTLSSSYASKLQFIHRKSGQ
jgi:surface antigen